MIKITVNRMGEFTLANPVVEGAQCGSNEARDYRYHVSITGYKDHLSPEGFVVDNLEVARYFDDHYHRKTIEAISCELMACAAIDYFRGLIRKNYPSVKCLGVHVRIWGSDKSFIEAQWEK